MGTVAVIGASLAGFKVAQELRRLGNEDTIVLVGSEHHLPYDRPPLSKGLLAGTVATETLHFADAQALAGLDLDLRLGEFVREVDLDARRLRTASGMTLAFDTLVIAAGTRPRRMPAFEELSQVHQLRTLDDALALRESLSSINRLAIVGGGLIGGEVAATGRKLGVEVTLIDVVSRPFHRTLGERVGSLIEGQHRDMGVVFVCGAPIIDVTGHATPEAIRLANDRVVEADAVLVGIGVVPNTEFLRETDLDITDGILCDFTGRCGPGVWAVGDIARWRDPQTGVARRFEHWSNAVEQARTVAWNIANPDDGARRGTSGIPYFWTDQYDSKVQMFGIPADDDEFVLLSRNSEMHNRLSGVFCRDGQVRAGVTVNSIREVPVVRKHVMERTPVEQLNGRTEE